MIEVIKFGADWCHPCSQVAPTVKKLQEKYNLEGSEVQITSIDIDKYPAMAEEYRVMSIPTFIIKKDGNVEFKKTGILQESEIEDQISKLKTN